MQLHHDEVDLPPQVVDDGSEPSEGVRPGPRDVDEVRGRVTETEARRVAAVARAREVVEEVRAGYADLEGGVRDPRPPFPYTHLSPARLRDVLVCEETMTVPGAPLIVRGGRAIGARFWYICKTTMRE